MRGWWWLNLDTAAGAFLFSSNLSLLALRLSGAGLCAWCPPRELLSGGEPPAAAAGLPLVTMDYDPAHFVEGTLSDIL